MDQIFFEGKTFSLTKIDAIFIDILQKDGLVLKSQKEPQSIDELSLQNIENHDSYGRLIRDLLALNRSTYHFTQRFISNLPLWLTLFRELEKKKNPKHIDTFLRSEKVCSSIDPHPGKLVNKKKLSSEKVGC